MCLSESCSKRKPLLEGIMFSGCMAGQKGLVNARRAEVQLENMVHLEGYPNKAQGGSCINFLLERLDGCSYE